MKKNLMLLAGIIITFACNAQKTYFGFATGTAISNYVSKVDGQTETEKSVAGLMAGILAEIPVGGNFSFQPALNFIQKGTKSEQNNEKAKLIVNCIEVPLNFLYNTTGNSGTFFIGAGPSFGFNISGKLKYDDGTGSYSEDIKIGNDPDNDIMKSLDIGANVQTGFRFPNGLFIMANYNAGLNNLSPAGNSDGTLKSHYIGIRLGWLLKGKNK